MDDLFPLLCIMFFISVICFFCAMDIIKKVDTSVPFEEMEDEEKLLCKKARRMIFIPFGITLVLIFLVAF